LSSTGAHAFRVTSITEIRKHLDFEWDEAKNRANIRKHGLDFADAEEAFCSALLVSPDTREDYGEKRWAGLGRDWRT